MDKKQNIRPSWDEYFIEIMHAVARRATCDRGRSGCVIARDRQVLVTGYVGAPRGASHCDEVGHQMKIVAHEDGTKSEHCMRTAHAEQNAIVQAARLGIAINGGTLYCSMTPCATCAKMIVNAGIVRVVCEKKYHAGRESERLFSDIEIELVYLSEETMQYSKAE